MKKLLLLLTAVLSSVSVIYSQIPNGGFESWVNMGAYSNPDNWATLNNMTAPLGVYTCTKGTPGNPGLSYIKLTSKSVSGMGVVPGIAVCGTLDSISMQPSGGFPFTARPSTLTGSWQHMIFGSSQGFIDVTLTYWDTGMNMRMPVANAHQVLSGMAMNWANFSIPLNYASGQAPDSCIIVLSSSGNTPAANDYLWVDNLNFSGNVSGISEINDIGGVQISPNPAFYSIKIDLTSVKTTEISVEIFNLLGKQMVTKQELIAGKENLMDITALPAGTYLLKFSSSAGEFTRSFVKN